MLTRPPIRIESGQFSNSLHRHNGVADLLVVESANISRICIGENHADQWLL
jgi:hypothetical protein